MPSRDEALAEIKDAFSILQASAGGFLEHAERELDLSVPHFTALEVVGVGARKVSDVAAMTRTHMSTASRAIDVLVDEGLVTREQDPDDRRAVVLGVTPAGQERLDRLRELTLDLMRAALADLPDDRLAELAGLLTHFGHAIAAAVHGVSAEA